MILNNIIIIFLQFLQQFSQNLGLCPGMRTFARLEVDHQSISFVTLTDDLSAVIRTFMITAAVVYLAQLDS